MRNSLYIFDLDHTLVELNDDVLQIDIIDDDFRTIGRVKYSDYLNGNHRSSAKFHFNDFYCSKKFAESATPIKATINILKQVVGMGCDVQILTARTHFNCRQTLKEAFDNLDIPNVPVNCCGFELLGNSTLVSIPAKKVEGFRKIVKNHHEEVVIYEDSLDNMKAIAKIAREYPQIKKWDFNLVELFPKKTTITKVPLV